MQFLHNLFMNAEHRNKHHQLPLSKDLCKHHNQALGDLNPTQKPPRFKHLFELSADESYYFTYDIYVIFANVECESTGNIDKSWISSILLR